MCFDPTLSMWWNIYFQNSKRLIAIPDCLWRRYADNEEISVWSDRWSYVISHPLTGLCFTPGGGEYTFGYFVPNLIMNEPGYSLKISFKPFTAWYGFIKKQWKVRGDTVTCDSQEINDHFIFNVERVDKTQPRCSQDFGTEWQRLLLMLIINFQL